MGYSTLLQFPYNPRWKITTTPPLHHNSIEIMLSPEEARSPIEHIRLIVDATVGIAEAIIYSKTYLDQYVVNSIPNELWDSQAGPKSLTAHRGKCFLGGGSLNAVILTLNKMKYRPFVEKSFPVWLHEFSPIDDETRGLFLSLEHYMMTNDYPAFLRDLNLSNLPLFSDHLPLTFHELLTEMQSDGLLLSAFGSEITRNIYSPDDLFRRKIHTQTALHLAVYNQDQVKVLSFIKTLEARINEEINHYEQYDISQADRLCLIENVKSYILWEYGSTLLIAIVTNQPEMLSMLLALGIRNTSIDNLYGNAICNFVDPKIIYLLLSYQIKFDKKDNIVNFLMQNRHHKVFYDYLEWFFQYKFQTDMRNDRGLKPLHIALTEVNLQDERSLMQFYLLLLHTPQFIPEGCYYFPDVVCDKIIQHNQRLIRQLMPQLALPKLKSMTSQAKTFTCELTLDNTAIIVELKVLSSLSDHERDACWHLFDNTFDMYQDNTTANKTRYFNGNLRVNENQLKYFITYKINDKIIGFIIFSLDQIELNKLKYLEIIFHLACMDKQYNHQKLGSLSFFYVLLIEKFANNIMPVYYVAKMIPPGFGYGMQPIFRYPKYQGELAYDYSLMAMFCKQMGEVLKPGGRLTPKLKVPGYSQIAESRKLLEFKKLAGEKDGLATIFLLDNKARSKLLSKIGIFGITEANVETGAKQLSPLLTRINEDTTNQSNANSQNKIQARL